MAGFLAAQFPGDYYGSDFAKSMDFLGYLANQRQREEAFKNQQINRDMALEDLFQTQQMNPLKRREQELINRTREVQIPGLKAVSRKTADEYDEWKNLKAPRVKQALADYALKAKKGEMEEFVVNAQRAYMDPNTPPQIRSQMKMILDNTPEMYKLNAQTESKKEIKATPTPRVSGGTTGGKPAQDPIAAINLKFAKPFDRMSAFVSYANSLPENDPNRARALAAAEAIRPYAEEDARNRVPGTDWVKDETGNWTKRKPAPLPAAGNAAPQAQPQAAPASFKSPDDVKAAYKEGRISKEQATGLLRSQFGYK